MEIKADTDGGGNTFTLRVQTPRHHVGWGQTRRVGGKAGSEQLSGYLP